MYFMSKNSQNSVVLEFIFAFYKKPQFYKKREKRHWFETTWFNYFFEYLLISVRLGPKLVKNWV